MLEVLMGLSQIYKGLEGCASELEGSLGVPLCVEGCGKCCATTTVIATRLEADLAISAMLGDGTLKQHLDVAEAWLLERHSVAPTYEGPMIGEYESKKFDEFYQIARTVPCPFMNADKRCTTHRGRPLVCRAYGVTHMPGPDPTFCKRPLGIGETLYRRAWLEAPELKRQFQEMMDMAEPDLRVSGLFPAVLFRQACPDKWKAHIADNKIATAKLIGLPRNYPGLLWQDQLQAAARN